MILERRRPLFAEIERPLLIWHLVFGLTLLPITMIRTGWGEALFFLMLFGVQLETANILGAFLFLSLVSFIPVVFSLPGHYRAPTGMASRNVRLAPCAC